METVLHAELLPSSELHHAQPPFRQPHPFRATAPYSSLRCSAAYISGDKKSSEGVNQCQLWRRLGVAPPPDGYSPGTAPPDTTSPDASLVPDMGGHALVKSAILQASFPTAAILSTYQAQWYAMNSSSV
ncbi:hypothetical protein V2G26_012538 [Clonostachys chloroleuca]